MFSAARVSGVGASPKPWVVNSSLKNDSGTRRRRSVSHGEGSALAGTTSKRLFLKNKQGRNLQCVSKRSPLINCVMEPPSKFKPSVISGEPFVNYLSDFDSKITGQWKLLPDIWKTLSEKCPHNLALYDPHHSPPAEITFKQLDEFIEDFAEGLRVLGIAERECVSLFSDNSHRWIIADQGIMMIGAMDAVRGSSKAPTDELVHIIEDSNSSALVLESPELLLKLAPSLKKSKTISTSVKFCILLWGSADEIPKETEDNPRLSTQDEKTNEFKLPFPVYSFHEILEVGHTSRRALALTDEKSNHTRLSTVNGDDVATIVYTSGTTGYPKGVMLTHSNLLHQVYTLQSVLPLQPGERFLTLLPPWHMYERSAEYFALSRGTNLVYSSVKTFKDDLSKYPPDYFVAVPLVFEILYNGVRSKLAKLSPTKRKVANILMAFSEGYMEAKRVFLGLVLSNALEGKNSLSYRIFRLFCGIKAFFLLPLHLLAVKLVYLQIRTALGVKKVAISGGGSLPTHVDKFFETIGIVLLNGYGLTETSPVLTARVPACNVLGSVGKPIPGTEIRIVDPETGKILPSGSKGIVKARGPQIMKGYFKNPSATSSVIDADGFFDTGDIGWLSYKNESLFPSFTTSSDPSSVHLVLEGRAKDTIILANGENVEPAAIEEALLRSSKIQQVMIVGQDQRRLGALILPNNDDFVDTEISEIKNLIRKEIAKEMEKSGFTYSFQRIGNFHLLTEPFSVENGLLTPTMKMKRELITKKYKWEIEDLFKH